MIQDATLSAVSRSTGRFAIGLGAFLSCLSISYGAADVCAQPADYSYVYFGYYDHEEANVSQVDSVDLRVTRFDLQYAAGESWTYGVGHRYDKFDFDPLELQTNGHLHTLFFPMHWHNRSGGNGFRISAAPALTASSNVIKEPDEYSSDTFHLLAALIWSRQLSDQATLRYGLCGDTRFGEYELYPSISVAWQPHPDWMLELGFPSTKVSYQATRSIGSSLRLAPDGNEWYVKDKGLEQDSQFVYEALLAEWAVNWEAHPKLTFTASVGRQFDIDYEVTLIDGIATRLSADSTTRFGAALKWRF